MYYPRFFLHTVLVVLLTAKVIYINEEDGAYTRAMNRTWKYFFFPDEEDFSAPQSLLYGVNDATESVKKVLYSYTNLNNLSTAQFKYGQGSQSDCKSEIMPA